MPATEETLLQLVASIDALAASVQTIKWSCGALVAVAFVFIGFQVYDDLTRKNKVDL